MCSAAQFVYELLKLFSMNNFEGMFLGWTTVNIKFFERINRLTGTGTGTGSPQPRVLLATFTSMLAKLKGTKILIYDDLTKGTYELLRLAKKKYGPPSAGSEWSRGWGVEWSANGRRQGRRGAGAAIAVAATLFAFSPEVHPIGREGEARSGSGGSGSGKLIFPDDSVFARVRAGRSKRVQARETPAGLRDAGGGENDSTQGKYGFFLDCQSATSWKY
nr:unnamed protein product [Callosobruchus analis]